MLNNFARNFLVWKHSVVLWQPAVPAPAMIDASIVARLVKEVEELLNHVTNENFEAAVDTARVLQQSNLGKQFPSLEIKQIKAWDLSR